MILELIMIVLIVHDILDIQKYLMKKNSIKQCLDLYKKCLLDY